MWIIDAYNVLGARPDGWWRNRTLALARLCDTIATWRDDDEQVVVMMDGWPRPELPDGLWRGIDVRYAHHRGPNAADNAIIDLVSEADDPQTLTVVTSDAWLRTKVLELGASVEGAGTFRARLDQPR